MHLSLKITTKGSYADGRKELKYNGADCLLNPDEIGTHLSCNLILLLAVPLKAGTVYNRMVLFLPCVYLLEETKSI
jgi:hypothetical protein